MLILYCGQTLGKCLSVVNDPALHSVQSKMYTDVSCKSILIQIFVVCLKQYFRLVLAQTKSTISWFFFLLFIAFTLSFCMEIVSKILLLLFKSIDHNKVCPQASKIPSFESEFHWIEWKCGARFGLLKERVRGFSHRIWWTFTYRYNIVST